MVIPKYKCGDTVFVYDAGRMVDKVISKIRITITDQEFRVGYQFKEESHFLRMALHDFYKDECEVFLSMDEFIKINT